MSTIVKLPGGATATLRDPASLKVRQRRIIEVAGLSAANIISRIPQESAGGSPDEIEGAIGSLELSRADSTALMDLQDATIVAFLESWTLPQPLPTMDTVGDMDLDVYDALAQATKELGAPLAAGTVDFSPKPMTVDSPTVPSSSSDTHLTADPQTTPTQPSSPDGTSTATASSTPA